MGEKSKEVASKPGVAIEKPESGQDVFIDKCPDVWDFGVEISTALDNE